MFFLSMFFDVLVVLMLLYVLQAYLCYVEALRIQPSFAIAWSNLAGLLMEAGELQRALNYYKVRAMHPLLALPSLSCVNEEWFDFEGHITWNWFARSVAGLIDEDEVDPVFIMNVSVRDLMT